MKNLFIVILIFLFQTAFVFSQEVNNYSNTVFLKLDDDVISQMKNDNVKEANISYNQINFSEAPIKRNYDKFNWVKWLNGD